MPKFASLMFALVKFAMLSVAAPRSARLRTGLAEVRPAEIRSAQDCAGKVRSAEVGPAEIRTLEVGTGEERSAQIRSAEICLTEDRAGEERLAEFMLLRFVSARSGRVDGLSPRQAFQMSTPWRRTASCSIFAMIRGSSYGFAGPNPAAASRTRSIAAISPG